MLKTTAIVRLLNDENTYREGMQHVTHLRKRNDNMYGNSFLLFALAWNYKHAALYLITLAITYDIDSLCGTDHFASSQSTPLILATKTHNNNSAMLLLGSRVVAKFIDIQDYMGNTALHYACLMKNLSLIEALLLQNADANVRNEQGFCALEYFEHELSLDDLQYNYGLQPNYQYLMKLKSDWDKCYCGTKDPRFSNYRWFLAHIVINLNLAKKHFVPDTEVTQGKIYFWYSGQHPKLINLNGNLVAQLNYHIKNCRPIMDIRLYNKLASLFVKHCKSLGDSRLQAIGETLRKCMHTPDNAKP